MSRLKYKAKSKNGEIINGTAEFETVDRLVSELHDKGLLLMNVKETKDKKKFSLLSKKKIKNSDLVIFCRQFHTMIDAGISILESLSILEELIENKRFSEIIGIIRNKIQEGSSLSEAMSQYANVFPGILIALIEVGEISGNLSISLDRLATYFEKEKKISQKIKTAMAYPAVVAVISVIIVVFMMLFVIPKFMDMFKIYNLTLPLPTRILIALSGGNIKLMVTTLLTIVGIIFFYKAVTSSGKGRDAIDKAKLKLPVIGNYLKKLISYRFVNTLTELIAAGIPLIL